MVVIFWMVQVSALWKLFRMISLSCVRKVLGEAPYKFKSALEAVKTLRAELKANDQYLLPFVIVDDSGKAVGPIVDGDAVVTALEYADLINLIESAFPKSVTLIHTLRTEIDELQSHINKLEEDKANLMEGRNDLTDKVTEVKEDIRQGQRMQEAHSQSKESDATEDILRWTGRITFRAHQLAPNSFSAVRSTLTLLLHLPLLSLISCVMFKPPLNGTVLLVQYNQRVCWQGEEFGITSDVLRIH